MMIIWSRKHQHRAQHEFIFTKAHTASIINFLAYSGFATYFCYWSILWQDYLGDHYTKTFSGVSSVKSCNAKKKKLYCIHVKHIYRTDHRIPQRILSTSPMSADHTIKHILSQALLPETSHLPSGEKARPETAALPKVARYYLSRLLVTRGVNNRCY